MITEKFDRFFKSDELKVKEAEELVSLLKNSPEIEERRRQRDQARVAKIERLLDELATLKAGHARDFPKVQAAADEALKAEKRAQEALQAATQDRVKAEHQRLCASLTFSSARDRLEREIQQSAPGEIDDFIRELISLEHAGRDKPDIEEKYDQPARITLKVSGKTFKSNAPALQERRSFLSAARREAEAMKMQALSRDDILTRLAKLKAELPNCARYTETHVELVDVRELARLS